MCKRVEYDYEDELVMYSELDLQVENYYGTGSHFKNTGTCSRANKTCHKSGAKPSGLHTSLVR